MSSTDEIVQALRDANASLMAQKAAMARYISLAILQAGGRLELTGAPSVGHHHMMAQHTCVGGEHSPQCVDVLELHEGTAEACSTAWCNQVRATIPMVNAGPGIKMADHSRPNRPYTQEEQMMMAAELRQHPERN